MDNPLAQAEGSRAGSAGRTWLQAALAVAAIAWGAQQFTPLLLLYRELLHLSATEVQATFVPYVVGLIPGLLFGGPCSDRFGRRKVMVPTVLASGLATVLLIIGTHGLGWIFAARFISGAASGAGFSCGGAWIKELSRSADGANNGPRRLTVAMGTGFALGPLVSGILAQWAPDPATTAYLPQLVLCAAGVVCVLRTPETLVPKRGTSLVQFLRVNEVRDPRFLRVVVPLAPWVFIAVAVAVGYLPELVTHQIAGYPIIFSALVVAANAGAGIAVQPVARRIDRPGSPRLPAASLATVTAGLLVAAWAAAATSPVLVIIASLVLGAGYGGCQVYGLLEVQRLARPDHLASLTATYQAISYVGFMASYPLAAIGEVVPAAIVLLGVAVLAAVTLVCVTRAAAHTAVAGDGDRDSVSSVPVRR
jgi:MFS family permease